MDLSTIAMITLFIIIDAIELSDIVESSNNLFFFFSLKKIFFDNI